MNVESFIPVVLFGLLYGLIFIFWGMIKNLLIQTGKNKSRLIIKNRVTRNHDVFINTLEKQEKLELPAPIFMLGNKDAELELTIFTSLYCGMCKDLCEIMDKIIFAYADQIKISVFFKTQAAKEKNNFLHVLHSIYLISEEKEFLKALNSWFKNKNTSPRDIDGYNTEENKDVFKASNEWFSKNKIISTPSIFIDGYIYPYEFEKEDLYYHIEQIIENKS